MKLDLTHPDIVYLVEHALAEDVGTGDLTTNATVDADLQAEGHFHARQPLVVAGVELLHLLLPDVHIHFASGDRAQDGDIIASVHGPARLLLTRERVSLNFLQRLCGVATLAARYVDAVTGTGAKILDTRKTTPGWRILEKMASAAGGVVNHRMGLYDAVLIKNNHIALAGGVRAAVDRALHAGLPEGIRIECEVRTRAEIDEALYAGASQLLLDNMTPAEAAEEIRYIRERSPETKVELSGGITLDTVRAYAEAGPDFISCGAITHSAVAVDLNFRLKAR
ncbi:MAG: carboxylating nicotinate-nucleotide diphosphorylase [Bryobacteraceae bacterium]